MGEGLQMCGPIDQLSDHVPSSGRFRVGSRDMCPPVLALVQTTKLHFSTMLSRKKKKGNKRSQTSFVVTITMYLFEYSKTADYSLTLV